MKHVEELCQERLDNIAALPAFRLPDYSETCSETSCSLAVTVAAENAYDGVFGYAQSPLGLEASRQELIDGLIDLFQSEALPQREAQDLAVSGTIALALPQRFQINLMNYEGRDYEEFMSIWKAGNQAYWRTVKRDVAIAVGKSLEVEAFLFGVAGARYVPTALEGVATIMKATGSEEPGSEIQGFVVSQAGSRLLGKFLKGRKLGDLELASDIAWDEAIEITPDLINALVNSTEMRFYRFPQWGPPLGLKGLVSKKNKVVDRGLDVTVMYDTKRDVVMAAVGVMSKTGLTERRLTLVYGIHDEDNTGLRGRYSRGHDVKLDADLEYK